MREVAFYVKGCNLLSSFPLSGFWALAVSQQLSFCGRVGGGGGGVPGGGRGGRLMQMQMVRNSSFAPAQHWKPTGATSVQADGNTHAAAAARSLPLDAY
jgi:hypothetical protein